MLKLAAHGHRGFVLFYILCILKLVHNKKLKKIRKDYVPKSTDSIFLVQRLCNGSVPLLILVIGLSLKCLYLNPQLIIRQQPPNWQRWYKGHRAGFRTWVLVPALSSLGNFFTLSPSLPHCKRRRYEVDKSANRRQGHRKL